MDDLKITLNGTAESLIDTLKYLDDSVDHSKYTSLSDTPPDYAGHGGKLVAVRTTEDGTEFIDAPSGGGSVESVFGRVGTVVAQAGDYTADDVTETVVGKIMTASERAKLAGIEAGATGDQTGSEIVSLIDSELGGTSWQSGGGGMTGAEIIAAINAELGNTDWQQVGGGVGSTIGPVEFIEFAPVSEPEAPAAGCRLYYDDSVTDQTKAFELRYADGKERRVYTYTAKD
jgi:hypothetical protein